MADHEPVDEAGETGQEVEDVAPELGADETHEGGSVLVRHGNYIWNDFKLSKGLYSGGKFIFLSALNSKLNYCT